MTDMLRILANENVEALCAPQEWAGQFTIVEDDRIRPRPLPGA